MYSCDTVCGVDTASQFTRCVQLIEFPLLDFHICLFEGCSKIRLVDIIMFQCRKKIEKHNEQFRE
jgi:hypothetical protein